MFKFSYLTIETAVANRSEAMEARDHFKNGASSKSLMSRKYFLSYFVIAALVVSAAFTSCGSRGSGGGSGNTPSSAVKKVLNAVIKNDADEVIKHFYNLSESEKNNLRAGVEREKDRGIVSFEIQDERIFDNGEKAEVIVKSVTKNGREETDKYSLVKTSSGWKLLYN